MRLGLLVASINSFGQIGFYNSQEIGLAKELDKLVDETIVYKLVSIHDYAACMTIEGCLHSYLKLLPSRSYGSNGLVDLKNLDRSIDALIFFSDTQIYVPKVYRWAVNNNIKLFPYIGVIESHSVSKLKRIVIDFLMKRNIRVYQKCLCLAKTPAVKDQLHKLHVRNVIVAPVGLDQNLLHQGYENADKTVLREKYLYKKEQKIILFIGRLIEEKQPFKMLDIFSEIIAKDSAYRLIMIGSGPLKEQIANQIDALGIREHVRLIDRVPNQDIWKWYCLADVFVNLNQQEIFGMSIMEAMYYGCNVVAWHAPGPDYIIENGVSGFLVDSDDAIIERIMQHEDMSVQAHQRIAECFTWTKSAHIIFESCLST